MRKNLFIILSFILSYFIFSCKKDNNSGYDLNAFQKCNNSLHLDTTAIANRLTGTWKMKSWYCGECTDPGIHNPSKTVIVDFTASRTFLIMENSVIISSGNWSFKPVESSWGLKSDSSLIYLHGYILLCDNQLMFSDSYIDGSDNLYEKLK